MEGLTRPTVAAPVTKMKASSVVVLVVNVAYAFISVVVLTLGAIMVSDSERLEEIACFEGLPLRRVAVAVLITGCAMVAATCVGFAGAVRDNRACLSVFAMLILASAAAEVIVGLVGVFAVGEAVDSAIGSRWSEPGGEEGVRCFERTYACCGYDAEDATAYTCTPGGGLPFCREEAVRRVEKYSVPVGWTLIVMGVLHTIALIMACVAACSAREERKGAPRPMQLRNSSSHVADADARGELGELTYSGGIAY